MQSWLDTLAAALSDRFRLDREIGCGGMATVYLAEDLRHHRPVAIKVLRPDVAAVLGRERFLREIEIAASLAHPNIVALLDSGEADGMLYYVMPYLKGESLRGRLARERELPVADTVRIVRGVLRALEHAHGRGIVHRDLKPENILLAGDEPLLADFGIAHLRDPGPADTRLTRTGLAVGTAAYMSPEQAAGESRVDERADIYALGLVWFEMLAGLHPFHALQPAQLMAAQVSRPVDPVRTLRAGVPEAIEALVARCLEKHPADRWRDATALLHQIDAWLAGETPTALQAAGGAPTARTFRLEESLLARLPEGFDPRMPGDVMHYMDNGRLSDTLVCYFTRWGIDASDGESLLREAPWRAIAPEFFGFEKGRRYRPALSITDHLVLAGGLIEHVAHLTAARHVILVGFSTGADIVLRMAGAPSTIVPRRIDGVVALGGNLAKETAFVSAVLAELGDATEDAALPFVQRVTQSETSLQAWIDVNEYLVRLVSRFRRDLGVLRDFAKGIASPFDPAPLRAFMEWYEAASRRDVRLRCVFEDNATYRGLVRELQSPVGLPALGSTYQRGSIFVEPGAGHFDLESTACLVGHIEPLVAQLRAR